MLHLVAHYDNIILSKDEGEQIMLFKVITKLYDKETNELYNKVSLTFTSLKELTRYINDLYSKFSLNYSYVKFEITDNVL